MVADRHGSILRDPEIHHGMAQSNQRDIRLNGHLGKLRHATGSADGEGFGVVILDQGHFFG
jgi:hypothetical protein